MKRQKKYIIDLDGTLAQHDYGHSKKFDLYYIGDPIPGAVQFVKKLASDGSKIVIFTRRMDFAYYELWTEKQQREIYNTIKDWLTKHGFPFDDIYDGQGKPDGTAFIDDRGVACRPQENANAYEEAIAYINKHILKEMKE